VKRKYDRNNLPSAIVNEIAVDTVLASNQPGGETRARRLEYRDS
jgi:hypothetical protein